MALSRVKTWNAAETLTASDLNAEFNNICNHFGSLDNDDIDSTATFTMGELIVGSGITSADGGQLHVHTATAGTIQASADADEAVFENSGASGVTILSGATSTGNIAFGDSGDADNGLLKYTHGSTPTLGITVDATAVQSIAAAATTLAHDLAIYQDANNADSQIALGTGSAEALFVEALNGASNKTLEELRFTTKTASGTANHGKMSFYVDEVNIGNVNDDGITLESGKIFTGNITGNVTGNTSGTAATVTGGTQAAITTCANLTTVGTVTTGTWSGVIDGSATMTVGSDATGDVYYRDASGHLERLGASTDGYVLTTGGAGTVPAWEALPSSGISWDGSTANGVATFKDSDEATVESNLTFDGTTLVNTGQGIGVGETPSTWGSAFDFVQIGGTLALASQPGVQASQAAFIVQNAHYDSDGSWEYQATDEASRIGMSSANITFDNAASGTAGNDITWSERMRIDSTGKVGIGTASPTGLLATSGGSNYHSAIGTPVLSMRQSGSAAYGFDIHQDTDTDGDLHLHRVVNSTSTMFMTFARATGNVGIGTASPDTLLHIKGESAITIDRTANAAIEDKFQIDVGQGGSLDCLQFSSDTTARIMNLTKTGLVGIGTTGPSHKIDVVGTAGLSTGTAWTNTSDARVKTDVETITGATEKLKKLRPVSYRYTDQYLSVHPEIDGAKTYHSFIADEYETVFPDAVSVRGDLVKITPAVIKVEAQDEVLYVDGDTDIPEGKKVGDVRTLAVDAVEAQDEVRETLLTDLKQFTPHDLQMFLTAAIQELEARVATLESA